MERAREFGERLRNEADGIIAISHDIERVLTRLRE